jgi:hypothetical protein
MQIYTITRDEIERYKLENETHGLPDNLDLLVAAVVYDREIGEPQFKATGIRWIDAEMCDADDNVIDVADVPKRTVFRLVSQQQMRKDFDKRREARLRRMGAL